MRIYQTTLLLFVPPLLFLLYWPSSLLSSWSPPAHPLTLHYSTWILLFPSQGPPPPGSFLLSWVLLLFQVIDSHLKIRSWEPQTRDYKCICLSSLGFLTHIFFLAPSICLQTPRLHFSQISCPLCLFTTFSLLIYLSRDIEAVPFPAIVHRVAMSTAESLRGRGSSLLGICQGMVYLDHMVDLFSFFERFSSLIFRAAAPICIPTNSDEVSSLSTTSGAFYLSFFLKSVLLLILAIWTKER